MRFANIQWKDFKEIKKMLLLQLCITEHGRTLKSTQRGVKMADMIWELEKELGYEKIEQT